MTCRVALLRMHEQGLITLPASRIQAARRRPDFPATPASDPQARLLQPVHEIGPLTLRLVAGAGVSRLWNEYVQRYHYLGYTAMSGSQLRYSVYAGDKLVALLSSVRAPGGSPGATNLSVGKNRSGSRTCSSWSTTRGS